MPFSLEQSGLIGIGGAVGAISRALVRDAVSVLLGESFPWGTLAVNVSGSFLAGFISGILVQHTPSSLWRDLLVTGFLGGYTTFSAFELDVLGLWRSGGRAAAAVYVAGSVLGGLIAVIAGYSVAELLGPRRIDGGA